MDMERAPSRPLSLSRRALLAGGAGMLLAACGKPAASRRAAAGPPLASPEHPVTWPIAQDNQPIASGLQPEQGATLKLYNWADYIDKKTAVDDFQKKYQAAGVKVQISTFNNMDEALAKIRSGQVDFDILFPTYDVLGKLIEGKFLRPLNHSYIPNISQVWPVFQNPFYDQGWRYSVPYTIYTTGIAWRVDKVSDDIAHMANPYDVFWDPRHKGRIGILDDYREAMGMVLLRNGITDLNTGDQAKINLVRDQLLDLAKKVNPVVDVKDYTDLPEGRTWITQAWSGDMVNAQYYMPKGQSADVIRYWFPPDGRGAVGNDLMVILRSGKNPVLAHLFLNYLLDFNTAMANFSFTGYQPPQNKLDPKLMVDQGYVPATMKSAVVLPSYFDHGYRELELAPAVDAAWHAAWQEFKAGA
jgi:spermidine/putrescine transport system substrate-binding protein